MPFDEPAGAPALETGAARPSVRQKVRVTNLYATPWHLADSTGGHELPRFLDLGRLEHHYRLSADQLPRVLYRETLAAGAVIFQRWQPVDAVAGGWAWFFQLPSGQLVAALTVDVHCGLGEVIDLLEDCYYGDVRVGGTPVEQYAQAMAVQLGAEGDSAPGFLSERHQIVFSAGTVPEDSEDLVQRLIYRADLPYRKDYSAIRYPAELNRRPGWLVAVGPYVSVVCGQQNYVENAIFVSAVQGVGAAAQLRAIRQAAYADVRLFRSIEGTPGTTRERRRALEQIADQLGDLELELSYSVEASADLGLLVPSLRTESFHNALYDSIGLARKAATAERMLERLGSAISAELTAIESIERRADDNRRVRYAAAVGFVSAVAIPASLILTFLGINASQVEPDRSMFSAHYLGIYVAVAALIVIGVALSLGLWMQHRRDARHQRTSTSRPRWTAAPEQPHS